MSTPIIIFSDSPAYHSGLARITRDLAIRISMMPQFRVATVGEGGLNTRHLPFHHYPWQHRDDYVIKELPLIWTDFCGDEPGIFLTIQDLQRVLWVADPKYCPDQELANWIADARTSGNMKLWGYFPLDAHGIGGKLGPQFGHILSHYDRRLAYTKFGADVIDKTLGIRGTEHLPHGINTEVFLPRQRNIAREEFATRVAPYTFWPQEDRNDTKDALNIGICATNQVRKDWGLGIETVAEIAKTRNVFLWAHTDALKREWSILELLSDFKLLENSTVTTGNMTDMELSWAYSAMDLTLGIARGEGFGYCLYESLACGVPCFHYDYAGGADYLPESLKVAPDALRLEGPFNLLRPVSAPNKWAHTILARQDENISLPTELDWSILWSRWEKWLKEGLCPDSTCPLKAVSATL